MDIEHIAGTKNKVADALSRQYDSGHELRHVTAQVLIDAEHAGHMAPRSMIDMPLKDDHEYIPRGRRKNELRINEGTIVMFPKGWYQLR